DSNDETDDETDDDSSDETDDDSSDETDDDSSDEIDDDSSDETDDDSNDETDDETDDDSSDETDDDSSDETDDDSNDETDDDSSDETDDDSSDETDDDSSDETDDDSSDETDDDSSDETDDDSSDETDDDSSDETDDDSSDETDDDSSDETDDDSNDETDDETDDDSNDETDDDSSDETDDDSSDETDDDSSDEIDDDSSDETEDDSDDVIDDDSSDEVDEEEGRELYDTPYGFNGGTGWSNYNKPTKFLGMKVVTKQLFSITTGGKCSITLGSDTTLVGGGKLMIKGLAWSKHAHLGYHFAGSFLTLSWKNDENDISIKSQKLAAENEKLEGVRFKGYINSWESKVTSQESSIARITQLGQKVDLLESKLGQTGVELENTQVSTNTSLLRKKVLNTRIQNVTQDCQSVAQSTDQCANALEKVFFNVKTSASIAVEDKKLILM
uniref:hypothetical protein n=1 Tax=uncultured Shewanella sp. TaxID=173975 RepID=UPI00260A7153